MLFTVVVSHYKENLDWLKTVNSKYIHLYSKGGQQLHKPYKVTYLPNVGRESHTYLRYIIDYYSTLPQIIVFTQGKDDHLSSKKIDEGIRILRDSPETKIFGNIAVKSLHELHLSDEFRLESYKGVTLIPATMNFCDWFLKYVDPTFNFNNKLSLFYGACFTVRKEQVLRRSKSYYEELMQQTEVGDSTEVSHFFERSWYYIFNCHK